MSGLRTPDVIAAAIAALQASAAVTTALGGTSRIYSHVPIDTATPYVVVEGGRESALAETFGDDSGRGVEVEATVVSADTSAKEVDEAADAVATVLLDDDSYDGVTTYQAVQFVEARRPTLEDVRGVLYRARTVVVRVWVL